MIRKKVSDAFVAFVAAMALSFVIGFLLAGRVGIFSTALAEIMLLLPACFIIRKRKEDPCERLLLRLPDIKSFFAGAFIYTGANTLSAAIIYALYPVYYKNAQNPDIQTFEYLTEIASPSLVLLCIAIIPAIVEEMFFRGYLLTAFTDGKKRAVLAISVSSVLFCIAHCSIYKIPSTLIIGIAFGYIAYKTGSVLITVILHFINNANSLISQYTLNNTTEAVDTFVFKDSSYYYMAVIAAVAGVLFVFIGVRLFSSKKLKLMYKIIPACIAVLVVGGCSFAMVANETETVLERYANVPVADGECIEETIILDRNTMCIIEGLFNYGEGVECEFLISDEEGEIVYDGGESTSGALMLEKGEYLVTVEFSVAENTKNSEAAYQILILSFGEYESVNP